MSRLLEVVKLLATLLGGGLAGAILTYWLGRRASRVQHVQLIERVNRLVTPVEGLTLARNVARYDPASGCNTFHLEEVNKLREYQLTMRNSTSIHLKDAEVQFEFPADDVQASAERPTQSRTPLVLMDARPLAPWKKAFRWRIPYLPSGDSVEFTFRAVAPSSENYEAALYHTGVVFEKLVGEPPPKTKGTVTGYVLISLVVALLVVVVGLLLTGRLEMLSSSGEKLTSVTLAGCDLRIVSLFDVYSQRLNSPWQTKQRLFNVGTQDCVIQSKRLNLETPVIIRRGEIFEREGVSESAPKLSDVEISVGTSASSRRTTMIPLYLER